MNDAASRLVRQYTVEHYDGAQRQQRSFTTCAETTLTIYIGGAPFVRMACSGETGAFRLYAGGGLLPESVLEEEWTETERKLQTMKYVIEKGKSHVYR